MPPLPMRPAALLLPAALALASCDSAPTTDPMQNISVGERACLNDVAAAAENADVVLIDSTAFQSGVITVIGVGPERARWRCYGFPNGETSDITPLTE